jgi:hypothetical protein
MDATIYYRLDEYEELPTDSTELKNTTWEKVLQEIKSIESHATVLWVKRTDID